jgi:hypothetical protein
MTQCVIVRVRLFEDPTEQAFPVIFECGPEWRVRSLRNYEISADEFCETTYGGYSIEFTGALDGGR